MNETIRAFVAERLAKAVDCPAKDDIIEEITADLTEQFSELRSGGMSEEQALEQVFGAIGDLSEVVDFINEADRRTEEQQRSGNSNPFAGVDDLLHQLAKDLSPSMRSVANDLRNAAGHFAVAARDVARDARGPLREMSRNAGQTLREGLHSVREKITPENRRHRYDYTVPSEGIQQLEIRLSEGELSFGFSQDDNIYIVELSDRELAEDQLAQIQVSSGTLSIRQGKKTAAGSVLFHYGIRCSDFEIYLPRRAWNRLEAHTSSGDLCLAPEMELAQATLQTASGDIVCPGLQCGLLELHTVSGDIELSGKLGELQLMTVSGDGSVNASIRKISGKSTSGDLSLTLDTMPEELSLTNVSGDLRLVLPDNDGFTLHYQRVSGEVRSDFDLKTTLSDRQGTAVYLSGGNRSYHVQTVSGDLRIRRR